MVDYHNTGAFCVEYAVEEDRFILKVLSVTVRGTIDSSAGL